MNAKRPHGACGREIRTWRKPQDHIPTPSLRVRFTVCGFKGAVAVPEWHNIALNVPLRMTTRAEIDIA